ncbi:hypothetical protein [Oleiphilus sp. HI0086]|uniref:hypothetical protein n=1 Tax=Oleiphilus sp. HI0086 TaxID=1822260 RepID=UPI0007C31B47|nr:hypothetical protein [Oleiphilus sp. HI0086]KZZ34775.1 hypothetical protein A3756_17205 [Oleiphilus sp. HI0086]
MESKRLSRLQQQKALIEKKLSLEKLHLQVRNRKIETRKRLLIGKMILFAVSQDPSVEPRLRQQLDHFLKTKSDRALFNLPERRECDA